ncbi:MAG TPA: SDR family oxidoreductase [Candidatus Tumulicola sp.]|jgi:3-oxoacyl-[acyl-carrier protein] reductase
MVRRALVTAAAAGLAARAAVALAGDGFEHVAITFRTTEPDRTLEAIRTAGASASADRVDFSAPAEDVAAALRDIVDRWGPFDTLVHGAGPLSIKRFERLTLEDYSEAFDGNVRSAVQSAGAVLPQMRAAKFGRIVLFGSLGAATTQPFAGFAFYQAAKSALTTFARVLALEEAGHGITVNVVVPGYVRDKTIDRNVARTRTARNPVARAGSAEDIADAIRFLVAPERDFITGSILDVTGGATQADERNEPAP